MSAVDKYRGQNGISNTGGVDPIVVAWDRKAAAATGADPVVLLATALQESGAQRGRVGDQGTSFGPWQFHIGGALGSHSPQWANTYAAALNRAKAFAQLKVHGGIGAAAVQRPRDRALYAQGVQSLMGKAREILGTSAPVPHDKAPAAVKAAAAGPAPADALSAQGRMQFIEAILNNEDPSSLVGLVQKAGVQGAAPGGSLAVSRPAGAAPNSLPGKAVAIKNPTLIGLPYQGTHKLYGNWESDNAIDIKAPAQTPVYAVADGVIGSQIGSLNSKDPHMAGERLHLKIPGNELYYQHLASITVKAGQRVKKGQLLGYTGALNHLHLGIKNGKPQVYA